MFYLLKLIYEGYRNFDETYRDKRSDGYFLAGSPLYIISLTVLYYVFVKHLGPKLMANRDPFELKRVIIVYNMLQVILNAVIFGKAMYHFIFQTPYPDVSCMMPLTENSELGKKEFRLVYAYFLLKIADFLDTIFFVLRKRANQISFLHVYHHILMCLGSYMGMRFLPGGHGTAVGILNTFVHVIMYFYYLITAYRPGLRNSLWWKKHITQLQILQFLLLIVHFSRPLFHSSCEYPLFMAIFGVLQALVMSALFLNFYLRAYVLKPQVKSD